MERIIIDPEDRSVPLVALEQNDPSRPHGFSKSLLGWFLNIVILASLASVLIIVFLPYRQPGFAGGYDTLIHFFKVSEVKEALSKFGSYVDWNPRWYGGYHQFLFYPPLFYAVAVAVDFLVGNLETTSKLLIVVGVFAATLNAYVLGIVLSPKDSGVWQKRLAAMTGAVVYGFSPALLSFIVARGKYPDYLAIALTPLVFAALIRWLKQDRRYPPIAFSLGLAVIFVSHIDTGVAIGFASILYAGLFMRRALGKKALLINPDFHKPILWLLSACALSALLTAWFWLPYIAQIKTLGALDQLYPSRAPLPFTVFMRGSLVNGISRYPGFVALGIACIPLFSRTLRRHAREWLVLLAAGYGLGFLTYTPVGKDLPGVNMLFYRSGVVLGVLALSGTAVIVVERLLSVGWAGLRREGKVSERSAARLLIAALLALGLVAAMIADASFIFDKRLVSTAPPFPDRYMPMIEALRKAPVRHDGRLMIVAPPSANYTYIPALTGKAIVNGYEAQASKTSVTVEKVRKSIYYERSEDYLFGKLDLLNVEYLLVDAPNQKYELESLLESDKFSVVYSDDKHFLFEYRPKGLVQPIDPVLLIGKNLSYPAQVLETLPGAGFIHGRPFIDDYSYEEMAGYPLIVLYNFEARELPRATELLKRYLENGGKAVIVMDESLSSLLPGESFLGVGSSVAEFAKGGTVTTSGLSSKAAAAVGREREWSGANFTGLDKTLLTMDGRYPVMGLKEFGKGRALFVGYNMFFHAILTDDKGEAELIREATAGLRPRSTVEVNSSRVFRGQNAIGLSIDNSKASWILLSMSWSPYWRLTADGKPLKTVPYEGLTAFYLDEGEHRIEAVYAPTPVHLGGYGVTALGVIMLLVSVFYRFRGWISTGRRGIAKRPLPSPKGSLPWKPEVAGVLEATRSKL
ncbi:MAG: 6-pyruvoyl-tetrahydropterin synthase-related protein [Candidatus Aquicultorales bacterium]